VGLKKEVSVTSCGFFFFCRKGVRNVSSRRQTYVTDQVKYQEVIAVILLGHLLLSQAGTERQMFHVSTEHTSHASECRQQSNCVSFIDALHCSQQFRRPIRLLEYQKGRLILLCADKPHAYLFCLLLNQFRSLSLVHLQCFYVASRLIPGEGAQ
jgi:hypothetical protein